MQDKLTFKLSSVCKSFGEKKVLKGIDLEVKEGSSLVILGGSGSGKSVLIKSIVGLLNIDSGSILYQNKESTKLSDNDRSEMLKNCGYLFQAGALFDSLSVKDNITFFAKKLYNLNKNDLKELAIDKLKSVGLDEKIIDSYPSELSGGMQKRVALARAICINPKIIFFDEPTTGLDPIMSNVINDLIIKIRDQLGATSITITHDMHSAKKIATDVAFLYQGKIDWIGSNQDIEHLNEEQNPLLYQFIHGIA